MRIFKRICQAFNEFMALPPDNARLEDKRSKTADTNNKKHRNKGQKAQQATPPPKLTKKEKKQRFYYSDDDQDYASSTVLGLGIFSTDPMQRGLWGNLDDDSEFTSDDNDSFLSSSSSLFEDSYNNNMCQIGGFDGIVGPDSADPMEQARWGGHDDIFSDFSDTFSSSDDIFSGSSWDD